MIPRLVAMVCRKLQSCSSSVTAFKTVIFMLTDLGYSQILSKLSVYEILNNVAKKEALDVAFKIYEDNVCPLLSNWEIYFHHFCITFIILACYHGNTIPGRWQAFASLEWGRRGCLWMPLEDSRPERIVSPTRRKETELWSIQPETRVIHEAYLVLNETQEWFWTMLTCA